jgi:iron complex outermembrane receptor protein
MKKAIFFILFIPFATISQGQEIDTVFKKIVLSDVNLLEMRASKRTPMTVLDLSSNSSPMEIRGNTLENLNNGLDIPYLIQWTPSITQSSDAGTGMGYTYLRMRGMDQTRINVTINGVPINDPESHGVFWVNTPDLTSSISSLQIQRGVGTSTVGAGAFGGSISMEVGVPEEKASTKVVFGGGSFGGARATYIINSGALGLTNEKTKPLTFMGRLSHLQSQGFIDRSSVNLNSYLVSGQYKSDNATIRLVHFSGNERTQQAWYGIPEVKYNSDRPGTFSGLENYISRNGLEGADAQNILDSRNNTYNYYRYPNEIDRYKQSHTHFISQINLPSNWRFNFNAFLVSGKGYFEQYKANELFSDYGLSNPVINDSTIQSTDLVRQRWLSNSLIGTHASLVKEINDAKFVLGGFSQSYLGDHYGTLPWMQVNPLSGILPANLPPENIPNYNYQSGNDYKYYESVGDKVDYTGYIKAEIPFGKNWLAYGDLQLRYVNYVINGIGDDQTNLDFENSFLFFNPKAGLDYQINKNNRLYASAAIANREPVRNDIIDYGVSDTALPETLLDIEVGYQTRGKNGFFEANIYLMEYWNQLVPTGAINDVGASLRMNVNRSYRRGLELAGERKLTNQFTVGFNTTWSDNRIDEFEEVMIDYLDGSEVNTTIKNSKIAMSPDFISNGMIQWAYKAHKELQGHLQLRIKLVGRQYLDNTGNNITRSLNPYQTIDFPRSLNPYQTIDFQWLICSKFGDFRLDIMNLFDATYAPNGYTWGYLYDGIRTDENFVFPMAGRNFFLTYSIKLDGKK